MLKARTRTWSLAMAAALGFATLSACGSSDSESSDGQSTDSASQSDSSGSEDASAEVTAAEEAIAPFLEPPTEIGPSEPLSGPVPTDKTWVVITCELPACQLIGDGALAAAEAAGVPTKLLSYKTTDGTTLTSAVKQALDFDPIAVSPIGFTQTVYNDLQDEYKDAGVFMTPIALGDLETSDVITEGSATQFDYFESGKAMASWVIADSGGEAKILVQDVPAFAVLKAYGDGFKEGIEEGCAACTMETLDVAPAQLASNGLVPATVSALQTNPDVEYLASTDVAFLTGIEGQLKAAGREDVKIVGGSADINNLTAVKNGGNQVAVTAAAENQYGWLALDIVFRTALGMDVQEGGGGRSEMIATQETAEPSENGLDHPADYEDQYLTLWGVN